MKKLITLLLVLTGMVSTAMATTYTVAGDNTDILGTSWDATNTANDMTLESGTKYILVKEGVTITESTTIKWKVCVDHDWETSYGGGDDLDGNKLSAISAGTYDLVFVFDSSSNSLDFVYVSSVDLRGAFSGWVDAGVLTRTGVGTYSGTLDLSATASDQNFKVVISNPLTSGESGGWLGVGGISVSAPDGWIGGDNNLLLNNSTTGYKTYTVTAVWTPGSDNCTGWTLTIAGDAARTNDAYSVSFVKVRDWKTVNAYVFSELGGSGNNLDKVSDWPGTAIAKSGTYDADNGLTYDVYTYNFNSYFTPQHVIFNNGTYETAALEFTNNKQYNDEVPDCVYAAVGANYKGDEPEEASALFFSGKWAASNTTDFMTLGADGHTYFVNFKNKELTNGTAIYTKVIKKATTTTATPIDAWYPTDEQTVNISSDGPYDVLVTFDTTYGSGLWDNGAVNITATATASTINVSAGAYGKATFCSEYPLDFTGVTDITAYTVSKLSKDAATLTKVEGVAPAETGLIIMGEANANEDVPTTTAAGSVGTNYLKAALYTTTVNDDYAYVLYTDGLFHPASAGTIPAGKAYLLASDIPAEARSLSLVFDDETTGINTVKGSEFMMNGADFFDLQGRKVAQPAKGLYIVNGKKVIIK